MDPLQSNAARVIPEAGSPVTEQKKSSTSCWDRTCMRCFRLCCFSVRTNEANPETEKALAERTPTKPQEAAASQPPMPDAGAAPDQAHSSNYTGHLLSGAALHSTLSSDEHRGRAMSVDSGAGTFAYGDAGSGGHSTYAGDLTAGCSASYGNAGYSGGGDACDSGGGGF